MRVFLGVLIGLGIAGFIGSWAWGTHRVALMSTIEFAGDNPDLPNIKCAARRYRSHNLEIDIVEGRVETGADPRTVKQTFSGGHVRKKTPLTPTGDNWLTEYLGAWENKVHYGQVPERVLTLQISHGCQRGERRLR